MPSLPPPHRAFRHQPRLFINFSVPFPFSVILVAAPTYLSPPFVDVHVVSNTTTIPSNHTEAEYAYQLRKQIIPLMMEPRFQPSGWLGIIVGTKLWMDFREAQNVEAGTSHLIRELGKKGKSQGICTRPTKVYFVKTLCRLVCETQTIDFLFL